MLGPSHADLVLRAVRWLRGSQRCRVVFAEFPSLAEQPDAIGWASGFSILVEVKVSRSDFRADLKKPRHRDGHGMGSRRWYMTPPGLVRPDEVPAGWGLAEVSGRSVRVVLRAVHRFEHDHRAEMRILALAVQRHQDGVPWFADTGRFMPTTHADHPMNARAP